MTASRQKNFPERVDSATRRGPRRADAGRAADPLEGYERDFAELPNRRQPRRTHNGPPSYVADAPVPGLVDGDVPAFELAARDELADEGFQSQSSRQRPAAAFSRKTVGVALAVGLGLGLAAASAFPVGGARVPADGLLVVSSHPSPAAVYVDGTSRGVTPLALELAAGDYDVDVRLSERTTSAFRASILRGEQFSRHVEFEGVAASDGVIERQLTPPATLARARRTDEGANVDSARGRVVDELPGPAAQGGTGWVTFPRGPALDIFEGNQLLGSSAQERLARPEGPHTMVLVSDALGFRTEQTVLVRRGQEVALRFDWPFAPLEIDTSTPARVTVDGLPRGETPLAPLRLPIGPHVVILTHPTLGSRRIEVPVSLRGLNRITVDFGSP